MRNREEELREIGGLLEGALPILRSLTSPLAGTPRVTTLRGVKGMKQVYGDALQHEFCALFNPAAMYKAFGRNVVGMTLGRHGRPRGRDLLVDNAAAKKYIRETPPDKDYRIRLLPRGMTFGTDVIVQGDAVAVFAYDDEKTIIRIENQNVADSFRTWFDALWKIGRKP